MLQKKNMRERIWYKNIWQRPTPEVDIQLLFVRLQTQTHCLFGIAKNLSSVGDGTGNFCEWAGDCRGTGGGRPSEGLRLDPTARLD